MNFVVVSSAGRRIAGCRELECFRQRPSLRPVKPKALAKNGPAYSNILYWLYLSVKYI